MLYQNGPLPPWAAGCVLAGEGAALERMPFSDFSTQEYPIQPPTCGSDATQRLPGQGLAMGDAMRSASFTNPEHPTKDRGSEVQPLKELTGCPPCLWLFVGHS